MKIIFLDIDGVLNSGRFMHSNIDAFNEAYGVKHLDPMAIARLNKIIEATDAEVVISSTWRILSSVADMRGYLKAAGFTGVVRGATPRLGTRRGIEIQQWLDDHALIDSMVILDDDSDMGHLMPFLVKTDWNKGLQDEHIQLVVDMLNK
jgi:hypothetical protein